MKYEERPSGLVLSTWFCGPWFCMPLNACKEAYIRFVVASLGDVPGHISWLGLTGFGQGNEDFH